MKSKPFPKQDINWKDEKRVKMWQSLRELRRKAGGNHDTNMTRFGMAGVVQCRIGVDTVSAHTTLTSGRCALLGELAGMAAGKALDAAAKNAEMKRLLRGKTPEQQKVIKYFFGDGGCMGGGLKDEEYEAMVMAKAKSMDFKKKALDKIGLDESQVSEVNPVHFEDYWYDDKAEGTYARRGQDGKWRSSAYQITWLFFSSAQMYVYQYTFNMDQDGKKESTEEYFYKDVTNFSTSADTVVKQTVDKVSCTGKASYVVSNVETSRFAIIVPGDKFYCAMKSSDYAEKAIQGMKAKLREKKGG